MTEITADTIKTGSVVNPPAPGLPTQVVHPWRTVARTLVQYVAGAIVAGVLWVLLSLGLDLSDLEAELVTATTGLLTMVLSAAVARVMAVPKVNAFLERHVRWLATGVQTEATR